ncbi:hypothetical protein DFJ74DRAFT_755170 [Hyaloraphidium curvatum]|nr:hypothetical protein DFJ74DRAFT_755170 [Hyaloraphidium curvatum]
MPSVNGYKATLVVDGVAAPEYGEDGAATATADGSPLRTVYVESATGKFFEIHLEATQATRFSEIMARPFIDGKEVAGWIFSGFTPYVLKGAVQNDGSTRPFKFASVKLVTDDDEGAEQLLEEQKRNGVPGGQMKIEFWSYTRMGTRATGTSESSKDQQVSIHEKAKKGGFLSHTTSYGDALPGKLTSFVVGHRVGNRPLATLVLEYRSRPLLEALGFHLPAEARQAGNQAQERLGAPPAAATQAGPRVKRENEAVEVKSEQPAKRFKSKVVGGVLTVDLTEDD